jgi:tetratricopeptide (TPR) repeat protein
MQSRQNFVTCVLCLLLALSAGACARDPEARKQRFFESGTKYFDAGKYREAVIEYQNAIQIDPRFGAARQRLAESLEKLNQHSQALEEYVRAADLLPEDVKLQVTAGNYLLAARRFDDAKVKAEFVLERNPREVEAQVLLGNALAGLRSLDQAIEEIEEAIRLDPSRGATYTNLAILEVSRGRLDAAEAAFKRAVELAPTWVQGHLALANHFWSTGRVADSERVLRTAYALEPQNVLVNRAFALFLIANNRAAEAEPYVQALATSGASPFALADYYLLQNRPGDAINQLQRLRDQSAMADAASLRMAQAYESQKDYVSAHRIVDEILQRSPTDAKGLLLKGRLLAQQGKSDEALAQFKTAAEANPDSAELQFALGGSYASRSDLENARSAYQRVVQLNPRAAAAQTELAKLDLASGKPSGSVQLAKDAVRNEPGNLAAQLTLARALVATGDFVAAEKLLASLLKDHPGVAAVHVQQALLLNARHETTPARREFERALELDRLSLEALSGLVALDIAARDVPAARRRVDDQLRENPERPALLIIAARVAAAGKDTTAAESYLRRAVELDPRLLQGYVMLGQLYLSQRKLPEARREFERLAQRQGQPVAALTMLGMLSGLEGDQAGSQKYFERVLEIDARAPVASNNLAWMYAERGENLDVALQLAQTAAATLPQSPEIHDTLGWVHYKRQEAKNAVESLRTATKLAPRNATYQYHLGLALQQLGNAADARLALQKALELDSNFPAAADARRLVAENSRPPR